MKLFKLFMFCVLQLPISVFYYLDPTNPIYFLIFQYGITLFIFMMDNAISLNYHNINALYYNFEELLKKITKAVPSTKEELEKEFDNE